MFDRIPNITNNTQEAMSQWFSDMADSGLIFHPEDAADSIVHISSGKPFFSLFEAAKAQKILDGFFTQFGDAVVNDAAYPHFMRATGFPTH